LRRWPGLPGRPLLDRAALARALVAKMVMKLPTSGGFRSEDGPNTFVVNRTIISTAKKQGWNVLQTLTQDPRTLIQSLRLA
jgi:hypothetical protein